MTKRDKRRRQDFLTRILFLVSLLSCSIFTESSTAKAESLQQRIQATEDKLKSVRYQYDRFVAWNGATVTDDLNYRCSYMRKRTKEGSNERTYVEKLQKELDSLYTSTYEGLQEISNRIQLVADSLEILRQQAATLSTTDAQTLANQKLEKYDDILHLCETMIYGIRRNCLSEDGRKKYAGYYATVNDLYQRLALNIADNGTDSIAYIVAKTAEGVALTYLAVDTASCQVGPARAAEESEWAKAVCSSYQDSITVPSQVYGLKVKKIGNSAFSYVNANKVNMPVSVDTIGYKAFYHAHDIKAINIPIGVSTIESYAFYGVGENGKNIQQEVTIPANLTSLGTCCFASSQNFEITGYAVEDGNAVFSSPSGTQAVVETETGCLRYGGTKTILTEEIKSIGAGSFAGARIMSVIIPEGITTIGERAFYDCSLLTSITLPSTLTHVGNEAFRSASSLNKAKMLSENPIDIGWASFDGISSDAVLYVPNTALATYKAFDALKSFSRIEALNPTNIQGASSEAGHDRKTTDRWYDLQGRRRNPSRGILIHNGRKVFVNKRTTL